MELREARAGYLVGAEQRVPKGYKQTEVGVIPEDWCVAKFCDVTKVITCGFAATPTYVDEQNGKPFLSAQNVRNGKVVYDKHRFVSNELFAQITKHNKPQRGDILYTRVGAGIGEAGVIEDDYEFGIYVSLTLIKTDPKKARSRYIAHLLNSDRYRFLAKNGQFAGGGVQNLNVEVVRGFHVPVPLLPEQEAIAETLSDADALIESIEQLIAKKRQIKQGAMQELLIGKKRLPEFSGEWEVKRLDQLANIQRGASPRPIDSPIWFDENSSVGWVRISDITKSRMYLCETTQRLSVLGVQHSRPVGQGSLIMSICATVGRPVMTMIDTCIHDGFVVFDNLQCDKYLLYYILCSIEGDWSRHGQTGSQMNLNTGLINRTEVLLPPTFEEQTAIAAILSDMDAEIAALEEKLAKTRAIKQGMMHNLLTGRIRLV